MRLYNSLTRTVEEIKPIREGRIGMYTCGPTVYRYVHIGNLRTFLLADLLRRALEFEAHEVTQIMNITDVGHLTDDVSDVARDRMDIAVADGRMVGVRGRGEDRVNRGRLGPKGLFGWQANNDGDRLTTPLVRRGGRLQEADRKSVV